MAGTAKKTTASKPKADEPTGLAATGNPNDMAHPQPSTSLADNTSANVAHQDGAPEALTKVADEAAEKGFLGTPVEKPDYSQANSAVMNQED